MYYAKGKSDKGTTKTKIRKTSADSVYKRTMGESLGAAKRKKTEENFLKMAQAEHKSRHRKVYTAPVPKN